MGELLRKLESKEKIVKVKRGEVLYFLADVNDVPKLFSFIVREGKAKVQRITDEKVIKSLIDEMA